MSVVTEFLMTIYRNTNTVGGDSWLNINQSLQKGLYLAIAARFKFEESDFEEIAKSKCLHFDRWAGTDNSYSQGEKFYSSAIEEGNISAAIAFERWKDRKPFIYLRKRLAIGSDFFLWDDSSAESISDLPPDKNKEVLSSGWKGDRWYVTSFSQDGSYINCSCYKTDKNPAGWRSNRDGPPVNRMKLTILDLKTRERLLKPKKKN